MNTILNATENLPVNPIITVFGIGGAGGNALNNMISSNLQGVVFVAANTDAQALNNSLAEYKIKLGSIEDCLGAGADPKVGAEAAEASLKNIEEYFKKQMPKMVFIAGGMGGGTGTGAAPVIARIAKECGILTVGIVTTPFDFEGPKRMQVAKQGVDELQKHADTVIIIPNQYLFRMANENTSVLEAFKMADNVLKDAVSNMTNLMNIPGLINLDFADISTVIKNGGKSMMGTAEASGEGRATKAAEAAISNPLLDHSSIEGAGKVLIHVTGGMDMTLFEVDAAANLVRNKVANPDANIIFGSTFNPELQGSLKVSVVATSIGEVPQSAASVIEQLSDNSEAEITPDLQLKDEDIVVPDFEPEEFDKYNLSNSIDDIRPNNNAQMNSRVLGTQAQIQAKPKRSIFSKMWNSFKSTDAQHNVVDPHIYNQEEAKNLESSNQNADLYEVPAFFRKKGR